MTQQNAALSEQSAASANSLLGRIEQLNALVAAFKTSRAATSQAVTPASLARAAEPAAASGEPERLRQLAEAAFVQSRTPPASRKVANARASGGWDEF